MLKRANKDEQYICDIANSIGGVRARLSTNEEDCGHQKADVIINYNGKEFYIQVSHTQKSKRQIEKLQKRGTYAIATHIFENRPASDGYLVQKISDIIN